MTCIAAIKHKGKIYVAGDRRASWDFGQAQQMPIPKVVKRDGIILAGTGSCYVLNLINCVLKIPQNETDIDTYMFYHFQTAVRKLLVDKGFCDEHKVLKIPKDFNTEIIIAVSGTLWSLNIDSPDSDTLENPIGHLALDQLSLPYATGCGGALAWGSLLTTEVLNDKLKMTPKERLIQALKVAAKVSPGCDDNVDIEHE